ncbi:MAG: 3'-phosphoesterase [Nitrospirae bacterium]|nr:MAG: 3'-phosphoesterase [Nitrospirota bacterium]
MAYFVVHEHHARRLHWDFRLEIDGVLKSWAVPKGPSMNQKDKRLAIMVEDHPLEYGTFEGIIPEGHYGAGPVVIWDSGKFELLGGSIDEGKLDFELKGKLLKGKFTLFRLKGKKDEWLLVKKKDQYADETFKLQVALTEEKLKTLKETVPPCEIKD